MASFTDIIPQFTPYVQQLPVEAMVAVGMEKQKRYDEGVQKIQQSIDKIAGLDVAADADKAYLQSKLNQLGNDLTFVAAGDFSNYQIVNSVDGMAKQIAYDPNVQNAVGSTAYLRKQQKRKEKAIEEGKSSPENEWMFDSQVSNYLNTTTPGSSFKGTYYEFHNVDKKLRGLAADLQKAGYEQSTDNPFQRDNVTGKTLYYNKDGSVSTDPSKGGTPRVANSMLTTTVKGIGAEKILNNFYDSLDENDKRQLNITAQYHYRDSTPITFQNDIIKTYNEKKKIYSDAIIDASVKLATEKLTPEQKSKLQSDINKAKELVYSGGFDKQMNEDLSKVDTEAEADSYKYKIYTQKYLTNLSKDLANESISTKYSTNPEFQAMMEKKRFEFDVQKELRDQMEWNAKHVLDLRKDAREEEKAERERKADKKLEPIVKSEKISTGVDKPSLEELNTEITSLDKDLTSSKLELGGVIVNTKGMTPEQAKAAKLKAANDLYTLYLEKPYAITDNKQRELIEKIDNLEYTVNQKSKVASAAIKAGQPFDKQIGDVIRSEKGLKIGNDNYTSNELYDFYISAMNKHSYEESDSFAMGREGTSGKKVTRINKSILDQYKGTKQYPLALTLYNTYNNGPSSSSQKAIFTRLSNLANTVSGKVKKATIDKYNAQSQVIADLDPQLQAMGIQFSKQNKTDMSTVDQIIAMKLKDYNEYGSLDSDNPGDFIPTTVAEIRKDGKANYNLQKRRDGSGTLFITGADGSSQKIPLTPVEMQNWLPEYSYINPITDIKYSVNSSPNKTTNQSDKINASTAGIKGFSPLLPGINNTRLAPNVRVDIEGSSNNIGDENDKFQIRMYYNDGSGWQDEVLNQGGYVNEVGLQSLLYSIGPKTIDTLFK
jgi:hypothetical protein